MVSEGGVAYTDEGIVSRPREIDGKVLSVIKVANILINGFVIP